MARYFIDTDNGDLEARDEEGTLFNHPAAARLAALEALPDMARDIIPDGDRREFAVSVRTEDGAEIYRATLTLKGLWRDEFIF
jgi:hypothetical protein